MNCPEAIDHLYSFLDEELTVDVKTEVMVHLEGCEGCFGHYEFERAFLVFLKARCKAQAAPPDLRRRVFEQVMQDPDRRA